MRHGFPLGAIVGGFIYAAVGAVMAAGNLRWFGWSPNANPLMVFLGLGLAPVVIAFALIRGADIWRRGAAGRIATIAGFAAPTFLLASALIEFAIFGTLMTFVAIAAFAILVHRDRLMPRTDIALLYVATIASITWNTETPSAALLIAVGLIASWISYRALLAERWATRGSGE